MNDKPQKSKLQELLDLIYKLLARQALERVYNSLMKEFSHDDRFKITQPPFLTPLSKINDADIVLHFEIDYLRVYGS